MAARHELNQMTQAVEHLAGIDVYLTNAPGIGGTIRSEICDFRVTEIVDGVGGMGGHGTDARGCADAQYLIVKLTKKNWDTHHLIRELSRRFGVSRSRFGWAGTKDKRAITTQRISIWDPDRTIVTRIGDLRIPDVELEVIGRSKREISLGDLRGNEFGIVIRDINGTEDDVLGRIANISDELSHAGGMPNFYGMQRFGTTRPVTHVVGKNIILGDFEGAAMAYLAQPFPEDRSSEVRRDLWDTHDFKLALYRFPDHLRHERAMLNHLVTHPGDYIGAFRTLQKNLLRMFVHAYQSFIFNKILSTRIKEGIPLNQAISGDVACFRGKDGLPDTSRTEVVTQTKVDGINNLIRRKRAWVVHSLIGYASEPGCELERMVVSDLGIDWNELTRGCRIPEMPELASKGSYRAVVVDVKPTFDVVTTAGGGGSGGSGVCVTSEFFLPKGCYATVLLREYMKNDFFTKN